MAEEAVIRAAERYDPARSSFPTYIHHRLRGVVKDYFDSSNRWKDGCGLLPINLDAPASASHGPDGPVLGDDAETLKDRQINIVGSYFPGGQRSAIPVPSDHWLAEGVVDLRLDKPLARLNDISAKAGLNERERIICANLLRPDTVQQKELAAYFGVSTPRMSAMVQRTIEKILAAY